MHSLKQKNSWRLKTFLQVLQQEMSTEIASLMPSKAEFRRNTRLAQNSHPWAVKIQTSLNQQSFFRRTSLEWNNLQSIVFPDERIHGVLLRPTIGGAGASDSV